MNRTPPLNDRERAVLDLMAQGRGNTEIAAELGYCHSYISEIIARLYDKIGLWGGTRIERRVRAVLWWQQQREEARP